MKKSILFTSESVTAAHPDRLCDTISDAVVDQFLKGDPYSRIVAECAIGKNIVFLTARFASTATVDMPEVTREVIRAVGYRESDFDAEECTVVTSVMVRPGEHRFVVDEHELTDAMLERLSVHSQATVFGFACRQTPDLMPLPIYLANRLARRLTAARLAHEVLDISPDGTGPGRHYF